MLSDFSENNKLCSIRQKPKNVICVTVYQNFVEWRVQQITGINSTDWHKQEAERQRATDIPL